VGRHTAGEAGEPSGDQKVSPGEGEKHNDKVAEKEFEKTAFGQLVLPRGHKKMVLSLISQHFRDKESTVADDVQNDIISGKGKGLIIPLHGLPGVGKTTTAEGVAELFEKPLFQITCGMHL
jgi:flagellar biosynthesis GTPase FlhF